MPTRGLLKEHSSLEQRTDGKTLGCFLAMWLILPSQQYNTEMEKPTRGLLMEHPSLEQRKMAEQQGWQNPRSLSAMWQMLFVRSSC